MRFRLFHRFRPSPRTQRRFGRFGGAAVRWLTYPFRLVAAALAALGHRVARWWETRNLRYLLQGLPSVTVAIIVIVVGTVIFFQDRAVLADQYRQEARMSLARSQQAMTTAKDAKPFLAMAQTCYHRLNQLKPDNDENSYFMAVTYDLLRQPQAADPIYESLAPPDKTRYGPAHLAVARRLLAHPRPDPAALVAAERHLLRAVHWGGKEDSAMTADAHALLFELYRLTNRPREAEDHLARSVALGGDKGPERRQVLAQWYLAQGRREAAAHQAEQAAEAFRKRLDEPGNLDDHRARAGLISCLTMTGAFKGNRIDYKKANEDYAKARDECNKGRTLAANAPLAQQYVLTESHLLLAEYDALANDPATPPVERFALLEQAVRTTPGDAAVLQRLVIFIRQTGPEGDKAREVFRSLTDRGEPSAVAHLILGTDAWQQKDHASARYHWEKAFQYSGGDALVANNLAWVLAHYPPEDLDRALAMIDAAIQKQPNVAQYHGTRGHILFKLGRYKEALPELEASKIASPNDVNLFRVLAETTEKLDMPTEAAHYRKRVEELQKKPAGPVGTGPAAGPAKDPVKEPAAPKP